MFRYLSLSTLCDLTFVVFLISWFITRQVGLFLVIRTSYLDAPRFIPFEWAPKQGLFLTYRVYIGFVAMLSILWILATAWFYMACNVAIRVVRGMGAEDSRSDDEDESEEDALEQVPESVGTSTATKSQEEADLRKRK